MTKMRIAVAVVAAIVFVAANAMAAERFGLDDNQVRRAIASIFSPVAAVLPPVADAASALHRRAACGFCRVETPTLVRIGDVATFSGQHGVSGTATIIARDTIRVTNLRHDGSAPGLDLRIGLATKQRQNFTVLRVTGRQSFQNATLDLTLPPGADLNSFDTFTVWCYEFTVIIAEGKFRRP